MSARDSVRPERLDPILDRLGCAADADELELVWAEGLRLYRVSADRERILATAGSRLRAFDSAPDDALRRSWLRQVAAEIESRGDAVLGDVLAPVASSELREAFAYAKADLAELRAAGEAGETTRGFVTRLPSVAARVRDLGRIANRLRGTGLLALVSGEEADLARSLADGLISRRHLMATVPESMRVNRDRLLQWARTAEAERELPRLIRSLIAETEPSAEWIDMPAGTDVGTAGWDGVVRCTDGNRFVLAGRSRWELSTQQTGSHGKACEDYWKRLRQTSPAERADEAYVAVVCAPWTKARSFADEKEQAGDYRSVLALKVDDIVSWLECAPVTTVWLREQLGEPARGLELVSAWWHRWLATTRIPLGVEVVLAGRGDQADRLRSLCSEQRGGIITIGGDMHSEEILAFVTAALVSGPPGEWPRGDFLYVDDKETAQRLLAAGTREPSGRQSRSVPGMTVVVPSVDFAPCLPPDSTHRLIVPIPGSSRADIVLDAVDAAAVADQMRTAGEDFFTAGEFGALARMSLLTLRRRLATEPDLHRPAWAVGAVEKILRRSIMLNSWNQTSDGDRSVVERFVGCSDEDVVEALHTVASEREPPMLLTDERWHVVAPADAWALIDDQISREDLELLGDLAAEVLTEPDPLYGLSQTERLAAQFEGVRARYSPQLRSGVATTLALLGTVPPRLRGDVGSSANAAEHIVARILRAASDDPDPTTWVSVADILPLLAEAAPAPVLAGLRSCLAEPHRFASVLFADRQNDDFGFPTDSPHLRVLEALELLAWSNDYIKPTTDLLAEFAESDPGGGWSNRPGKSLAEIMCPWSPHTSADSEQRLAVLDMLRGRHGAAAWDLMLSMLPSATDTVFDSPGPRFRPWMDSRPVVTEIEYDRTVSAVASRLVDDAGTEPERLAVLVERVGDLAAAARKSLHASLAAVADSGPGEEIRSAVWSALRRMISLHRDCNGTSWALPEIELVEFEALLEPLRPSTPLNAYGLLFGGGFGHIDGISPLDHEAYTEALAARRVKAVEAILDLHSIGELLEFAAAVAQPYEVGLALATIGTDFDSDMLSAMNAAPEAVTQMALGYFCSRFSDHGWDGIRWLIEHQFLTAQVTADLFRAIPATQRPWREVNKLGGDVAAEYWGRAGYWYVGSPPSLTEVLEVSQCLRGAGRAGSAASFLAPHLHTLGSEPQFAEEAAACLEERVEQEDRQTRTSPLDRDYLTLLMDALDRHREHLGPGRVAAIEWRYYRALRHDSRFKAPNLYRELAQNPDFFVSLVELAFKPAHAAPEVRPELSDADRRRALNADSLLRSWPSSQVSPGADEDGKLDEEKLNNWVDRARDRLAEVDRAVIGDQMIGKALAVSPPDPGGEWPSLPVRELIERLRSDDVDLGLHVALRNQRGATNRSPTDGGDQERQLVATYREKSRNLSSWPRTAAIFEGLAASYESDAALHDRSAEAVRRGLPL
ncbi:MAG: hypothetical protein OXG91_12985 [bacterium]|nr:hypothetical protein [bacterium]